MKAAAYLAGGILIGFGAAYVALEGRFRKEYDEKSKSLHETYEFIKSLDAKGPVKAEDFDLNEFHFAKGELAEHEEPILKLVEAPEDGTIMVTPIQEEPVKNDYHKVIAAVETSIETFVDGGINDYGVSYIEEEEYQDDDGRAKEQIVIMMDEHNPIFLENGTPIDDWDQKVGDSIIVDFYRLVPPGVEPILYVRNHRTDVDYEVVRAEP